MKTKTRDSRFELLRIFSMLLIVAHHFAYHGGYVITDTSIGFNVFLYKFFEIGGKVGVNLFVLISGYFLINSKFKISKLIKLLLQVFTYSFVIYIVMVLCGNQTLTFGDLVRNCLPTMANQYWFATCYVALYLLSPYINACLNNISKKQHLILIAILLLIGSILPYIPYIHTTLVLNLGWFLLLYIIGAYISKYGIPWLTDNTKQSKILTIVLAILLYLIILLGYVFLDINLASLNNIFCLCFSILVFLIFRNMTKIKNVKWINIISSAMFGVYLIHDNNYLRPIIWQDILKCPSHFTSNNFWLFSIGAILSVFVICTLIELIRIYLIEKPIMHYINSVKTKKTHE